MTEPTAVLFDLDGVLVDSRVAFARGVNSALVAHGLPARPEEELHRYLGPPLHSTFAALVAQPSLVQPCVDAYRERSRALGPAETTVFPGIRELLETLSERLPLVVATSKSRALAEPLLRALGLRTFFRAVVGPELSTIDERKAVTVGRALAELPDGARPVMVGDRKYDIVAAHAHRLHAIGVLWGIGSEEELRAAGADELARTPDDLVRLLGGDARAPEAREPTHP